MKVTNITANKRIYIYLAIFIMISFLLILIILIYLALFKVTLPNQFPIYRNGTEIKIDSPLSDDLRYYECTDGPFVGLEYEAFYTMDERDQVLSFYRQFVKNGTSSLIERPGLTSTNPNTDSPQDFSCFLSTDEFRSSRPTNVIVFLSPTTSREAKIITKNFANIPTNKLVVLLLRGYVTYI